MQKDIHLHKKENREEKTSHFFPFSIYTEKLIIFLVLRRFFVQLYKNTTQSGSFVEVLVFIHLSWGIASMEKERRKGAGLFRCVFLTSWYRKKKTKKQKKKRRRKKQRSLNVFFFFSSAGSSAKQCVCQQHFIFLSVSFSLLTVNIVPQFYISRRMFL